DNPGVPGLNGNVVMTGDIGADLASRDVSAGNFSLKGDVAGLVPEGKARFELRGNARANLDSLALTAPDLVLQADGLAMQGVNGSLKASLGLAGNIEQRRFDLSALKASGKFQGSALPLKGEVPLTFSAGSAALDLSKGNATLNAFDLNIQSLRSSGSVTATALLSNPRFSGQLEIAPFNLRALLTSLNQPVPTTADAGALTTASLSTQFKSDLKTVTLDKFRMKLDDTSLAGSVTAGLEKDAPLRLDLSLDALDADRYLPPQSAKPAATPASAAATAITLPVEQLRALDVEGRLRAGQLKVTGLRLEDVDVGISAKRGKIHLNPLKSALYGGRYAGNLRLDVSSARPMLSLDERVSGLKVDSLLKDLQIDPGGVDFSGGVSDLRLRGDASGDVAQNSFQFKDLSLDAAIGGKSFPGGKLAFNLQTDADVDLGKQSISARAFQLKFGPLLAKGQLGLTQFLSSPKYAATIEVPAFNARSLLATLGQPAPATADPKALTSVALSAKAVGSVADVSLDPLALNLDGTRLQGKLALSNLQAALPTARFDLKADQLDADRYLPPTGGKAKAGTPGAAATAIPVDTLRALDLDGRIGVGELKIANLRLQNVVLVAKGKDGRLQLSPLNAQLYQGTYAGNIVIDASGKQPPRLSLNEKLTGVQAGPLLQDLQGDAPVTGRADVFARLNASGADTNAMKRTLSGDTGFTFLDGTIRGIDMLNTLCKAFSGLNVTSLRKEDLIAGLLQFAAPKTTKSSSNQTEFAELKGTLNISNGLAKNDDLSMKSPLLRVGGKGDINLATERIDYLATVALVSSCQGQGGQDFRELAGIPVPVRISGPLANPKYEPQIGAGIMQALSRSKPRQPAAQAAPTQPQQPVQPTQPKKPEDALKDAGKKAVGDLLRGILK
ncbi:MAG TPA: AsmA family protein, partial [Gammaproteobacteria bacterium]